MSPEHWPTRSLASLAKYLNGFAFKPEHWQKDGLPIIRIEQINDPDSVCDFTTLAIPPENIIDNGDLVFSWSATLKVVIWQRGKAALNQHLFKVLPAPDVDRDFLFFLLDHFMDDIGAGSHGSTMKHIKRSELERFLIKLPPLPIQQAIASVLRGATKQLDQTEALIAKQERIRAGLLQDLFTRGVDQNGALRPPREEAPDLYHQTELGWLPKGWHATRVGSLFELIYRYPTYYGINYVESGVPEVRGELILDNGTLASSPRFISSETAARFPKVRLELNDIVMSVRGTIGKFATVSEDYVGGVITANLLRLKPRSAVRSDFLMHLLKSSFFQERLETACSQTTIRTIQMPAFCDILVPMAPEHEQTELALILNAIRAQIESEVLSLEKRRALKSALMQDLLTGRVSVAPLLQAQAA